MEGGGIRFFFYLLDKHLLSNCAGPAPGSRASETQPQAHLVSSLVGDTHKAQVPAVEPGSSYLTPLGLSFLIWKMGFIRRPIL